MLEELVFVGNFLEEKEIVEGIYRDNVVKKFLKFKKFDGKIFLYYYYFLYIWFKMM